jgi:hypothetical protein
MRDRDLRSADDDPKQATVRTHVPAATVAPDAPLSPERYVASARLLELAFKAAGP